jgi:phosphoribosylamine--glycine ligase
MRILVLGSGAREHALVLSLFHDPAVDDIHVAPGNVGMKPLATLHSEVTRIDDPDTVVALARDIAADLVVIGPEIPLVAGVADALRSAGFLVFGPNKAAARIEGSKAFAKDVMAAAGVRTARSEQLTSELSDSEIESALDRFGPHYVVKDDGLAGGKGVVVTDDRTAARAHVDAVLAAGNPVLLESFLTGPEVSLFCFVDGETVVPLIPAQDHKRVGDGDQGPNTGGMGAYCPLPWLPADGGRRIVGGVCVPGAKELVRRGGASSGLLYAGVGWGAGGPAGGGGPRPALPPLEWYDEYAVTVVLAAEGYPEHPHLGEVITGASDESAVRHAGTAYNEAGELVSAGGRVLNVIGTGATLADARDAAYSVLSEITLPGGHYRSDIALPAVLGNISV